MKGFHQICTIYKVKKSVLSDEAASIITSNDTDIESIIGVTVTNKDSIELVNTVIYNT